MTTNSFSISSSWDLRAETAEEFGERIIKTMDALSQISPLFQPWWIFNASLAQGNAWKNPKAQRYFSLNYARDHLTEIMEMAVDRDDGGESDPDCGYLVLAVNSQRRLPQTVELHAWGADNHADFGGRGAAFSTEFNMIPDPEIVAYPVFKAVLMALVSNFDVAYAKAYSSELSVQWRPAPNPRFIDLSWMTCLSAPLAQQIAPPTDVLVEKYQDGGVLMIAAEETFDVNNADHMHAARSILRALKPLNDAEDKKREQGRRNWKKGWLSGPSS